MDAINSEDVRGLFRLVGELRELGDQPTAWRRHLADGLGKMCGARAAVIGELVPRTRHDADAPCRERLELVDADTKGLDESEQPGFMENILWIDYRTDPVLSVFLRFLGVDGAQARSHVVADDDWYRSVTANERFRPHGVDDFIMAQAHSPAGAFVAIGLYRAWGDRLYSRRERMLVELVNEEIVRGLKIDAGPRLGPRRRAVLVGLQTGASEKEIAAALDLSPHTAHDHVKAIYRAYGVRARPELMAKMAAHRRRGLRLVSHG
jgi:DNA-binding CsgD family transcriptional regulator